jgi:predicted neutral ceramidase superfamily lipid hydrolase
MLFGSAHALAEGKALALTIQNPHNFGMTLKQAAFLALAGMALLTVLLTANLISSVSGLARGIIPAVALFTSLIHWLASLSVLLFFAVFYKKQ